jgi:hypothetical protein
MGFTCGIVGLPNVGKSTIFNALTNGKAQAANFPFCTIDPNTGTVPVPDPRLLELSVLAKSAKLIPAQVTFVDIAGLIKGAASGEGLGNKFLSHIRSVDAVIHVVRCFENDDVIHVAGGVDPARDLDIILTELIYADLEATIKQRERVEKSAKSGDKDALKAKEFLAALELNLGKGQVAASTIKVTEELPEILLDFIGSLLTNKPAVMVANVSEEELRAGKEESKHVQAARALATEHGMELVVISGQIESELAGLEAEERKLYLEELGATCSGLDRLAIAGYKVLGLNTFFTVGPKEAHAWTIPQGILAPEAAGKIHTDFEKNFIRAEVISYEDYIKYGSEVKVKEAGRLRVEGKEYIVADGDVMHFRIG